MYSHFWSCGRISLISLSSSGLPKLENKNQIRYTVSRIILKRLLTIQILEFNFGLIEPILTIRKAWHPVKESETY